MNDTADRTSPVTEMRRLAPRVESHWAEEFVVEQRLLGVPGERIGDALATVDAHVADSGETAREAFGSARAYAREVGETERGPRITLDPATVAGSVFGLLAIVLVPRGFAAWLEGEPVVITVGDLVATGLVAMLSLALFMFARPMLRALVDHRWVTFLVGPGLVVAFAVPMGLLRAEVATASASIVGGIGLLSLLASVALLSRMPTDGLGGPGGAAPTSRTPKALVMSLAPAITALMCLLTWVVHQAA